MVVTFLPTTLDTGVMQDRIGRPSRCTVHAPHSATPQPNFVPVRPTTSRSTHRSGMSSGTSSSCSCPLITNLGIGTSVEDKGYAVPLARIVLRPTLGVQTLIQRLVVTP